MKHVPILAVIVLGIVLLNQHGTTAGGNPPPRAVPVIIQDVGPPPSKMVAINYAIQNNFEREQVPIPLGPGQVFILSAWLPTEPTQNSMPFWTLFEGPSGAPQQIRDRIFDGTASNNPQHVFPTGIRFPRDAAGMADIYVHGGLSAKIVFVQGYITDDS